MNLKCFVLLISVAAMAGCSRLSPARHTLQESPTTGTVAIAKSPTAPPTEIDDYSRTRSLERAALRMMAKGTTVPIQTLITQLDRRECRLALSPTNVSHKLTAAEIYQQFKPSVLLVSGVYKCPRCGRYHTNTASGFFITATGAFVTGYHVVNNKTNNTMVAMTDGGKVFPVKEVLAASRDDDVAILRVDGGGTGFQPVALSTDAPVGSPVYVISHPNGRFYTFTDGLVSRYYTQTSDGKAVSMMAITADFARGSSGAPVFNEYGAVVSFVASTMSVYYHGEEGKKDDLQMVFKQCVPARSVLKLIKH